jgi:ATP-binding cassette subfamily F protein 3
MAQVAQDMPETAQSATFVVEGDLTLLAARREVAEAEAGEDYMRMATPTPR